MHQFVVFLHSIIHGVKWGFLPSLVRIRLFQFVLPFSSHGASCEDINKISHMHGDKAPRKIYLLDSIQLTQVSRQIHHRFEHG